MREPLDATHLNTVGILVDDFGNMNGGYSPPHHSHQDGLDIDAYVADYQKRNADAERKLVEFLRAHYREISRIFVACANRSVAKALAAEPALPDGTRVATVIRNESSHTTHFHIRLKSKNPIW